MALIRAVVRNVLGFVGTVAESLKDTDSPTNPALAADRSLWVRDAGNGRGIVDDMAATIGAGDIDATKDTFTTGASGKVLGPVKRIRLIAGSGPLVYVDDPTGTTRTIALLAGDEISNISIRTIKGTNNGTGAGILLRVGW